MSDDGRRSGAPQDGSRPMPRAPGWLRPILFTLGCLSTSIGVIGLVLPGLPGTVFLIAAAWCFTRSSPRFEAWLLEHRTLGPPVRQWRATRSIPRAAKIFACVSLAASWALIGTSEAPPYVKMGLAVLFVAIGGFIVSRPEASSL